MTDAANLKQQMLQNAGELVRLMTRIDETVRKRDDSGEARSDWMAACEELHSRYDCLAFPGGYSGAAERILSGDPFTLEAALCFVEIKPYFFRSGYMYTALKRKLRRALLSKDQKDRFNAVEQRDCAWRPRNKPRFL